MDIKEILRDLVIIKPIIEEIKLDKDFLTISSLFSEKRGTVALLSGGHHDCARFNILAVDPVLVVNVKNYMVKLTFENKEYRFRGNPFGVLRDLLNRFCHKEDLYDHLPVVSGLFGYFSYDLKDYIEDLPRTSIDDLGLPDIFLCLPKVILLEDRLNSSFFISAISKSDLESFKEIILESSNDISQDFFIKGGFNSNFSHEGYINAIERIKNYILEGHVYQVNMSQRFSVKFSGNPFSLLKKLFIKNPAPFFAYINADDHYIISTSPERFLLKKDNLVETRPIKGTRPRGNTTEEDLRLKKELVNSIKDDAELSMIVDLLRNDLGKVCKAGTVKVKEHKRVESYDNVYHLVSIVEGEMEDDKDEVDLLMATFPGGSITGCPKVRAMEIIDELEPNRRHIYTGSIGYISFHKSMDLSIAIRTAIILGDRLVFSVGGGVVFDSDPEMEYQETLHKGRTFLQVLGNMSIEEKPRYVWFNGSILSYKSAKVPIENPSFSYGFGIFETIRANKGKSLFLEDHINRLNNSFVNLFEDNPPDLTWDEIINQLIEINNFSGITSKIKVIVGKASEESGIYDIFVSVTPYEHRLKEKGGQGFELLTYPHPRQTPLADFKSLNYLYYLLAGRWAKKKGKDEALILNPDGSVSETNTANIFIVDFEKKELIIPSSIHVLSGVMLKKVCELLSEKDFCIKKEKIYLKDLLEEKRVVLMSNSLIGVVPVLCIDDCYFYVTEKDLEFIKEINITLIGEEIP